jgi:hypothetical protein
MPPPTGQSSCRLVSRPKVCGVVPAAACSPRFGTTNLRNRCSPYHGPAALRRAFSHDQIRLAQLFVSAVRQSRSIDACRLGGPCRLLAASDSRATVRRPEELDQAVRRRDHGTCARSRPRSNKDGPAVRVQRGRLHHDVFARPTGVFGSPDHQDSELGGHDVGRSARASPIICNAPWQQGQL